MRSRVFFLIFSLALGLLIQSCYGTIMKVSLVDSKPVMGSWRRTSGGYQLLIKEVDGKVIINYINPSQGNINVSYSKISMENNKIKIEVTLSDTNYPDSRYVLFYDDKADTLNGKYTYSGGTPYVGFMREVQRP